MFNLYQLVTSAHGGQGIDSLAQQFGLTREQADGAVQALMPALSTAFMTKAAQPGGLGEVAGAMTDDEHRQAHADPVAAQDGSIAAKGGGAAASLFGGDAVLGHVTRTASQYTGLPESTIQAMLPVVTSLVLGGAAEAMHRQGMGGMLGQLASGGLGGMLSQFGGAPGGLGGTGTTGAGMAGTGMGGTGMGGTGMGGTGMGGTGMGGMAGGLPGMLGNIFSSFFGGAGAGAGQTVPNPAPGTSAADPAAGLPPMVQAGLDQLFKMFQPGVAGGAPTGGLADMIGAALGGRR